MARGRQITDDKKREVALTYYITGSQRQTAIKTGVDRSTICVWVNHREWFQDLLEQVASEAEDKIRAQMDHIIELSQRETLDRLENGDVHVNAKGQVTRAPIKARDAATIAGIAYDKRRISLNLPTSISGNTGTQGALEQMAKEFKKLTARYNNENATIPATQYAVIPDQEAASGPDIDQTGPDNNSD